MIKYKISLQVSMLGIFLTLFIVTMLTIMSLISYRFYQSLSAVSTQEMHQVTSAVNQELGSLLNPAESASQLSVNLIKSGTVDIDSTNEIMAHTIILLRSLNSAQMTYWADTKGNFTIARMESDNSISSELINRNKTPTTSTMIKRDSHNVELSRTVTDKVDYDPRVRPWYTAAIATGGPVWSQPYVFYSGDQKSLGITFAAPIYNSDKKLLGVFGIDMRLGAISKFLQTIKVGQTGTAFIIDNTGQLIAHSLLQSTAIEDPLKLVKIQDLNLPWMTQSFLSYQKNKLTDFSYKYGRDTYMSNYSTIPQFKKQGWLIGVVIPENDFIGQLKRANTIILLTCVVILLIGLLIITTFSKQVTASIQKLVLQTEKIRQFDLSSSGEIDTHIKEISYLASGITSMQTGLKAFQKYVPADLVRNLIKHGVGAKLGGKRTQVTIMFTDIEDFTNIAESLSAEKLMKHLCLYFDYMSKVINQQNGTIDKFIGDSIMAFWNSPLKDPEHCYHGCLTALVAQKLLGQLNDQWSKQNIPTLATRFGIHTGDAIVGNLGASDRLNYTAIGDTINIASRLEAINKVYGTSILVSEAVVTAVNNHFIFRKIDCIALKGKAISTVIYELLDLKTEENAIKYQQFCHVFANAHQAYQEKRWEDAIAQYHRILEQYPDDSVAKIFLRRCEEFNLKHPPESWDGVWRYDHK